MLRPIARRGDAEIGSHMHVWTIPPRVPMTGENCSQPGSLESESDLGAGAAKLKIYLN
jgi:hypothetical protein